jgi:hypothetical protein
MKVPISSAAAPYSIPRTPSEIASPAFYEIIWIPMILSVSASVKILTNPSVSLTALALNYYSYVYIEGYLNKN